MLLSSSVACLSRRSRDCRTPERRSFLRTGTRSSRAVMSLPEGAEQLEHRAGEARRGKAPVLRAVCGQWLQVKRAGEDAPDALVAVVGKVVRPPAGCRCPLGGELLEIADDGLHVAQLGQDIVGGDDVADVGADVRAQGVGTLGPEGQGTLGQGGAMLRQVLGVGAHPALATTFVGGQPLVIEVDGDCRRCGLDPHPTADVLPGHRVEPALELDMAVGMHGGLLPDDRLVGRGRQGQER